MPQAQRNGAVRCVCSGQPWGAREQESAVAGMSARGWSGVGTVPPRPRTADSEPPWALGMDSDVDDDTLQPSPSESAISPLPRTPDVSAITSREPWGAVLRSGPVKVLDVNSSVHDATLNVHRGGFEIIVAVAEAVDGFAEASDVSTIGIGETAASAATCVYRVVRQWTPFTRVLRHCLRSSTVRLANGFVLEEMDEEEEESATHHFFCVGDTAARDRAAWLKLVLRLLAEHTATFFAGSDSQLSGSISSPRVVSGSLLLSSSPGHGTVVHGELRWSEKHGAHLLLSTGLADEDLMLEISPRTTLLSYRGLQCTMLRVDLLLLCARTPAERDLWVGSVSSLQNSLPISVAPLKHGNGRSASAEAPPSLEITACLPNAPPGDDLPAEEV
eukprot:NODE_12091_length_1246_cov_7.437891.p1 GENE.NODE_12091_length_1246_cov_7.437891~~NODE_12091_length_1246_cov_7.437891.p1  ORF type:complete len:388 (-),score=115.04 NODE_12091_length_1246_cov_7.437891:4-1167(-)